MQASSFTLIHAAEGMFHFIELVRENVEQPMRHTESAEMDRKTHNTGCESAFVPVLWLRGLKKARIESV